MTYNNSQRTGWGINYPDSSAAGQNSGVQHSAQGAQVPPVGTGVPTSVSTGGAAPAYGAPAGAFASPAGGAPTPPPPPTPPEKPKKKRGAAFYIAIAVAVVAVVCAALLAWQMFAPSASNRDRNAIIGQLDGKTEEEVQAELDRIVEEGMFNISIASTIEFEDGTSEGPLHIENVPSNYYLMQVDITRNDTGELIYQSGILEPNYHIQDAKLDVVLPAGTYDCTATFYALDPETEEEVGQAGANITITVLN